MATTTGYEDNNNNNNTTTADNNGRNVSRNAVGNGHHNAMNGTTSRGVVDDHDGGVAEEDGYAVDIRIFLFFITIAMAASFMLGVSLGPSPEVMVNLVQQQQSSSSASQELVDQSAFEVRNYDAPDWNEQRKAQLSQQQEQQNDSALPVADEHLPAGQHLLVDMDGVDGDFLNSEERLSRAMVETIQESGLTMLSYHCHALLPSGISCVGVLLESHISFHTWPEDGVITLDLFTCGPNPLLPVVETIERLFGIPDSDDPEVPVKTKWSHELRGFRPDDVKKKNYLDDSSDLSLWVLSPLELHYKKQIYSAMTDYQRVDIWDIVEITDYPLHQDIIKHNITLGDPRASSPDYVDPARILFLDGIIQSMSTSERVYHEAMVHPAMFAHPHPKTVLIVGGGEGATLREVLKHKTVESVIMIEIDSQLIPLVREYLPSYNDCSDFMDRNAVNCFDDDIVSVVHEDGRKWFMERYGGLETAEQAQHPKIDVILMDALDPEDDTDISAGLYSDKAFVSSLMNSLSSEGVLAIQVGTAAKVTDPRPDFGIYKTREALLKLLETNEDVAAVLVYEEENCGFLEPHAFLVACKSVECRSRWYARNDQVDYQIYDRITRTHSKERALVFYDGTTQFGYQWPKKGWETTYCRREPTPVECNYLHLDFNAEIHEFDLEDEEESSFQVEILENEETGEQSIKLFATCDIPKGSYIMPGHMSASMEISNRNLEGLKNNLNVGGGRVAVIEDLLVFFEKYAHHSWTPGSPSNYVEIGGSVLIRRVDDPTEANVAPWMPHDVAQQRPKYSPVFERHRISFDVFMVASKDIKEGEEIKMHKDMWNKEWPSVVQQQQEQLLTDSAAAE